MSAEEFKTRLEATRQEIARVEAEMESLGQAKDRAIAAGDGATAVKLKHQVDVLQKPLEDLVITKAAFEAKLRIYKVNEAVALKVRQRLAGELWPSALLLYDQVKGIQAELGPVLEKITQLNDEMLSLANQHKALIGDKIYTPRVPMTEVWYVAANTKLDSLPKLLDVRLPAERERNRVADQLKEQKPTISKILKKINIDWPLCPACGAELLAQRYELAEDGTKGHAEMRCPKHPDQWLSVTIPARPVLSAAGLLIPTKGPLPSGDVSGSVPYKIHSHNLAQPGLTEQNKGVEKTK